MNQFMGSQTVHKLGVIEFTDKNTNPAETESWSETCKKVVDALEEYGCFVAVYHKLTQEIHQRVFESLQTLFDLPTQTKIQNKSSKPLYGYVGQIPFLPLYESMGIDDAHTIQGIQAFSNVMWPNGNHAFCENLVVYTKLAAELEKIVVRMVFENYGVGKCYESHVESANYLCRVMKYREPEMNENRMAFVSHTDKSFMSTIHQNEVDGLEIKAKDGEWFGVNELPPSSIIVMAGDAIMAWSNKRIKSPHHRVTMEAYEARYSVAQFSFMEKTVVQTPDELVDEDHPLQFNPFDHLKFLHFYSQEENRRLESAITTYCGV